MRNTFNGVIGIALLVGEMFGLLVGVTVTDGGCNGLCTDNKFGGTTFPSDIDIASDRNDFCDDDDDGDDAGLLGKTLLFFAYDVEPGELVFVIVKLGVIFMLACELFKLAAKMSAYPFAEPAADVIA